jgi:hypothetical protein
MAASGPDDIHPIAIKRAPKRVHCQPRRIAIYFGFSAKMQEHSVKIDEEAP